MPLGPDVIHNEVPPTGEGEIESNMVNCESRGKRRSSADKVTSRIATIMENRDSNLQIKIIDAGKFSDSHSHQLKNYVVYLIQLGTVTVKRRYSEFEALRKCLKKEFPTLIIPPIPEKQSLKSNIAFTTTNSFGFASSALSNTEHNNSVVVPNKSSDGTRPSDSIPMANLVEYRKRMLAAFLNKIFKVERLAESRFFLNFLDPEVNFLDYVTNKENNPLYRTSIYRLSPSRPLENLENQLYLTLPIPSSADSHLFKELSEEEQFQKFVSFEAKFIKYELVLSNISKLNKHLMKHIGELSEEISDLGSSFSQLSLIQDSTYIENIGRLFERHKLLLSALNSSINIGFMDKLMELKHFSITCKGLMEYNRKKIIQYKLIEKDLYNTRSRYKRYEVEEIRIRKIDQKMENVLHKGDGGNHENDEIVDPPITDEELQTALYSKSYNKPIYGKIPGVSKLNNIILKYVSDPNPDETRRTKFYNLKLRLFQLERQYQITQQDLGLINSAVMSELEVFHNWFKEELRKLVLAYNKFFKEYFMKSRDSWIETNSD